MRTAPFSFNGQTYHLLFNGAALFDIYDEFGTEGSVTDHILGKDRKALEALCWYLEELAWQGELLRRYEGRDPQKVPAAADFLVGLGPMDVLRAQDAVRQAVCAGFLREEEEKKEVDKGLLELEKKRQAAHPGPVSERRRPIPGAGRSGGPAPARGADPGYGGAGGPAQDAEKGEG